MRATMRLLVTVVAGLSLLSTTFTSVANAAMIGTQSAMSMEQRSEYIGDIKDWLSQEAVRKQLVQLGVNPSDASERISSMTPEELRTLHQRIDNLPAGAGLLEILGIVFVVLLILELVGVTNVFSNI